MYCPYNVYIKYKQPGKSRLVVKVLLSLFAIITMLLPIEGYSQYVGGDEDGSAVAQYNSSHQCTVPVPPDYPYIGGIEDGFASSTYIGNLCNPAFASDIYKGGFDDGYNYSSYLSTHICVIPVAATPPYIGGNGCGNAFDNYFSNINCNNVVSDIYKGGNGSGDASQSHISTQTCFVPQITSAAYYGGSGDGNDVGNYLSSYKCTIPVVSDYPYIGGNGSGYNYSEINGLGCLTYVSSDIYRGGNHDGFDKGEYLSSHICYIPVVASPPYTGGDGRGDAYSTYLSSVNCNYILSDIYKGGNDDGYSFIELTKPNCITPPITATVPYVGGIGEGHDVAEFLSPHICYVPVASTPPYQGGDGQGANFSSYLSNTNCNISISYIYTGGVGSGDDMNEHISSYSCTIPSLVSDIYKGGVEDGNAFNDYVSAVGCIAPPLASNIYIGGNDDGSNFSNYLSSHICLQPLVSTPPYQGGFGHGAHYSSYLSSTNCSIIASNIYYGGNGSGDNKADYLSTYTCSVPQILADIYKGGVEDGSSFSDYVTNVSCIYTPLVSNIYKGGNDDGSSFANYLSNYVCVTPLASVPPYIGGYDDGSSVADYYSSYACLISTSYIYTGGNGDGNDLGEAISTYSCLVPPQLSDIYRGGSQDGADFASYVSSAGCIATPTLTDIYKGGNDDGSTYNEWLSSYICYVPIASTPPYQGGFGQGWSNDSYYSPYTCNILASNIYLGGNGSGDNKGNFVSSYSCYIPPIASDIYKGGMQDGSVMGDYVTINNCIPTPVASAAYFGGVEDGNTVADYLSTYICSPIVASTPPYQGGFNAGNAFANYYSSSQCGIIASNIYIGGFDDGNDVASYISSYSCYIPQITSYIYTGGFQDGNDFGEVVKPGCYTVPSSAYVPYTGGNDDGSNYYNYLSSYQCVIPVVAEYPYIGGEGDGFDNNTFYGIGCGTYSLSNVYYGGFGDGYAASQHTSSYQCVTPVAATPPYMGGEGSGDIVATYISSYQCNVSLSTIYFGGNDDGYANAEYVTQSICLPPSVVSAIYAGGNGDGNDYSDYLSSYQCVIPAVAEHPYIGGSEDGYASSTWSGTSCSPYATSAIYYGGNNDGYGANNYLSNVICAVPTAAAPPYIGGDGQGSYSVTYVSSYTCSITASTIYYGGNGDGYAVNDYITSTTCFNPPAITDIYRGGFEDGNAYSDYLSSYQCVIPAVAEYPYIGGNQDGHAIATWAGTSCSPYASSAIYYGGTNDGYGSSNYLSNVICYIPIAATPPYIGGDYAGNAMANYLSTQTCNPIISDIHHGGNGQGYAFYDLVSNISIPIVNVTTPSTYVCASTPITFTATPIVGAPPYIFNWYVNGMLTGATGTQFTSSSLNDGDEVYSVMGAMTCSSISYDTSNIITVSFMPAASIPVFVAGADTLCAGQSSTYEATAINASAVNYSIVSGSAVIDSVTGIVSSVTSDFVVRATAKNMCANTYKDYPVKVVQYPILNLKSDTTICYGASITLNASGADSYQWNYSPTLSSTSIPNPVANPIINSTYVVTGTNWTCSAADSVNIDLTYCDQVWTGLVNDDWHNAGNWSLIVPISQTNAIIPTNPLGGNVFPIVNANAECKSINIEPVASLTINIGNTLSVFENWTNNGVAVVGNGTVRFEGLTQTIAGTTTFGSITVNSGSSVTMLSPNQKVTRIVRCDGTLYSNGNMTLVSNASGTALISGSGIGSVVGTVTQQRFIAAAKAKGYKHFSTAFSNSTLGHFSNFMTVVLGGTSASPYPTIFKYSEAAASPYFGNGWVAAAPQGQVNTPVEVGTGYTAQFGASSSVDKTAYLFGEVNNGIISKQITRLNPGTNKGDGWNFLGNPYPSPIDLDKLDFNGSSINMSVSIFISTSQYNGYYGYYNASIHFPINGGTRHLGALHAFYVQRNVDGIGTFTFNNSMRSEVVNPLLYKNDEIPNFPIIKLSGVSEMPDMLADETVITFHNDASEGNDSDYDIGKLWNTDNKIPNLYSVAGDKKLAMNGLPLPQDNTVIPLGFKVPFTGNYSIKATDLMNINKGVWLEDVTKGSLTNLKQYPEYSFAINAEDPAEGRFFLRFGEETATGLPSYSGGDNFSCWSFGNQIVISYNAQNGNNAKAELFDALGRKIYQKEGITPGMHTLNPETAVGVYMLRFTYPEGNKTVKLYLE